MKLPVPLGRKFSAIAHNRLSDWIDDYTDDEDEDEEDEDDYPYLIVDFAKGLFGEDEDEDLDASDAAYIWLSSGKDEDYMFGFSEDELEGAT